MVLLALVPFLALVSCAAFLFVEGKSEKSARYAFLQAAVLSAVWCVLGTELLSLFKQLRMFPLLLWWGVPVAYFTARTYQSRPRFELFAYLPKSSTERLLLAGVAVILLISAVVAIGTPPNNYDSQEYHLPRQWVWSQQGHVGTFAANDERQLSMPPFAEFAGVHLMILSGGDRAANLVQWLALVLVAVAASYTAGRLGAPGRMQLFAALFAVTYPTAALQAVNTKNDLVTAFFVCSAALYAGTIALQKRCSWKEAFLLSASIGIAMLSKGTGMLFVIPISVFAGTMILRFHGWRGVAIGAFISVIVLLINCGHFTRNYSEFKSIFGRTQANGGYRLRNETHAPAALLSNVSKNIAMHLTFSRWSNGVISNGVAALHTAINFPLNDPRTSYDAGGDFEVANSYPRTEDQSRAPLHMVIGILTFGLVLWSRPARPLSIRLFCLIPFAAFLLFCFELKWQIWHNRLQVPLFCLLAPVAAVCLARYRALSLCAAVVMFVYTLPAVAKNSSKPLLGRNSFIFRHSDEVRFHTLPSMLPALRWVEKVCRSNAPATVALHAYPHTWIYPVQRAVANLPTKPKLFLLNPAFGKRFAETNAPADLIVCLLDPSADFRKPVLQDRLKRPFQFAGEYCNLAVYLPVEKPLNLPTLPPFHGWVKSTGLSPSDGPFPRKGLSIVRSGVFPNTTLIFLSDNSPKTLTMVARAGEGLTSVPMTVSLNGLSVFSQSVENDFSMITIPLSPRSGTNEIQISYQLPAGTSGRALLFKQLQLR